MKIAEKILSEIDKVTDVNDSRTFFTYDQCLNAMKLYANAKLDEAAEKAKAQLVSNNESVWYSDAWAEVDKESILLLKDIV